MFEGELIRFLALSPSRNDVRYFVQGWLQNAKGLHREIVVRAQEILLIHRACKEYLECLQRAEAQASERVESCTQRETSIRWVRTAEEKEAH